jgi:hypothetical protein
MDKFLELSFRNYVRNEHDSFPRDYQDAFEPFVEQLYKVLSKEVGSDLEDLLIDCYTNAMYLAGVAGMQLAINVLNGTDIQTIDT